MFSGNLASRIVLYLEYDYAINLEVDKILP